MLHLVFTFQAGKSCNVQTKQQTISSSSWGNWEHWVATKSPCTSSHSISFSLSACLSVFLHIEKQYGDQLHRREEAGGLGGRARGDDEVEGGLGCKV